MQLYTFLFTILCLALVADAGHGREGTTMPVLDKLRKVETVPAVRAEPLTQPAIPSQPMSMFRAKDMTLQGLAMGNKLAKEQTPIVSKVDTAPISNPLAKRKVAPKAAPKKVTPKTAPKAAPKKALPKKTTLKKTTPKKTTPKKTAPKKTTSKKITPKKTTPKKTTPKKTAPKKTTAKKTTAKKTALSKSTGKATLKAPSKRKASSKGKAVPKPKAPPKGKAHLGKGKAAAQHKASGKGKSRSSKKSPDTAKAGPKSKGTVKGGAGRKGNIPMKSKASGRNGAAKGKSGPKVKGASKGTAGRKGKGVSKSKSPKGKGVPKTTASHKGNGVSKSKASTRKTSKGKVASKGTVGLNRKGVSKSKAYKSKTPKGNGVPKATASRKGKGKGVSKSKTSKSKTSKSKAAKGKGTSKGFASRKGKGISKSKTSKTKTSKSKISKSKASKGKGASKGAASRKGKGISKSKASKSKASKSKASKGNGVPKPKGAVKGKTPNQKPTSKGKHGGKGLRTGLKSKSAATGNDPKVTSPTQAKASSPKAGSPKAGPPKAGPVLGCRGDSCTLSKSNPQASGGGTSSPKTGPELGCRSLLCKLPQAGLAAGSRWRGLLGRVRKPSLATIALGRPSSARPGFSTTSPLDAKKKDETKKTPVPPTWVKQDGSHKWHNNADSSPTKNHAESNVKKGDALKEDRPNQVKHTLDDGQHTMYGALWEGPKSIFMKYGDGGLDRADKYSTHGPPHSMVFSAGQEPGDRAKKAAYEEEVRRAKKEGRPAPPRIPEMDKNNQDLRPRPGKVQEQAVFSPGQRDDGRKHTEKYEIWPKTEKELKEQHEGLKLEGPVPEPWTLEKLREHGHKMLNTLPNHAAGNDNTEHSKLADEMKKFNNFRPLTGPAEGKSPSRKSAKGKAGDGSDVD